MEELRRGIEGPNRVQVLLKFAQELTIAGRASYPGAGLTIPESQEALQCINELQIVALKQLAASVVGTLPAYPDDAFIEVLEEKAALRACEEHLRTAARLAAIGAT